MAMPVSEENEQQIVGPTYSFYHLPQELHDLIIDMVMTVAGRNALSACMATCRVWHNRSRSILFRGLCLKPRTDFAGLYTLYTPEGLLPFVKAVSILGCLQCMGCEDKSAHHPDCQSGLNEEGDPDHTWMNNLFRFLTQCTNIESLELDSLSWGDVAQPIRQLVLTSFSSATRLDLHDIDFWNSNQLFKILEAFPHLSALALNDTVWHLTNHTRRQISSVAPLTLENLRLENNLVPGFAPLVQWLCGRRETVHVEGARIYWDDTDTTSLVVLIRRMAPSLKSLTFLQTTRSDRNMDLPFFPMNQLRQLYDQALQRGPVDENQSVGDLPNSPEDDDDQQDMEIDPHHPHLTWKPSNALELEDDEPGFIVHDRGYDLLTRRRFALTEVAGCPIENSRVEILHAHFMWSPLAEVGVALMIQLINVRMRVFQLTINSYSEDLVDWCALDAMLSGIRASDAPNATFDLQLVEEMEVEDDLESAMMARIYSDRIPRIREAGVFRITRNREHLF